MAGFWSPFDTEEKRTRLAFLGGGIAAVAAALWAVFIYLKPAEPAPKPSATVGGVAVGGNVSGSTINTGPGSPPPLSKADAEPKSSPLPAKEATQQRAEKAFEERAKREYEYKMREYEYSREHAERGAPPTPLVAAQPPPQRQPSPQGREEPSVISCQARSTDGSHPIETFFPWPPPQGSAEKDFTESVLSVLHHGPKSPVRLGEIDGLLRDRLRRVGHSSLTYFITPRRDGYAAITHLEQIDATGVYLKGSARFSKDTPDSENLLYNFTKRLVSLPEGRFRLLVFFVTGDPVVTQYSMRDATIDDVERWVGQGCKSLPPQLASIVFTDKHHVLLRIYEFTSKGATSRLLMDSNSLSADKHMLGLGLDLGNPK